jgi:hypothetical protein
MFINDLLLFFHAHGRRLESNWIRVHELFQLDQIKDEHDRQNVVYRLFSRAYWKSRDILWYKFPNGESIVVERHQKDTEIEGVNGGRWWIRRRPDLEKEYTQSRKPRGETNETKETKEDNAWIKIYPGANKENIVITQIPFSSLGVTGTSSSKVKRGVTNDQDLLLDSL